MNDITGSITVMDSLVVRVSRRSFLDGKQITESIQYSPDFQKFSCVRKEREDFGRTVETEISGQLRDLCYTISELFGDRSEEYIKILNTKDPTPETMKEYSERYHIYFK